MKRVAIYCFYDSKGIVDDYVFYYLAQLSKLCEKILFVSNGELESQSLSKLKSLPYVDFYKRKNEDFDAGAFKFGFEQIGDDILQYDQLVLSNNSFFGPVYPLEEAFDEMQARAKLKPIDFWGMTIHPRLEERIADCQQFDYINEHVQSYFVVFNKNVISSDIFKNFLRNLPKLATFNEAVCLYELRLTYVLSQAGFKYDSYVDQNKFPSGNITILYPYDLVKEAKMPLIKRKAFLADYQHSFAISRGHFVKDVLNFIKEKTDYDVSHIWQHLLRTSTMSQIRMNLQLNKILDTHNVTFPETKKERRPTAALILYIYYAENIDGCFEYAKNVPDSTDLYMISAKQEVLDLCRKKLAQNSNYGFKECHFVKKINKGRDLSSYLIDCSHVFNEYDYVCYFHDKKSPQLDNQIATREFFDHCMECLLPSKQFAVNVINNFEMDDNLGLLVPPPLVWGQFYATEYLLHPDNAALIKELISDLDLNVPFDPTPVAPYGDMFWIRGKAALKLFNKKWTYEDLPPEPLAEDGTLMHALERILPFVAQSSGFYTSWLMSDVYAPIFINNLYYIDKTLNQTLFGKFNHSLLPQLLGNITDSQPACGNIRKDYWGSLNKDGSLFFKIKVHNIRKFYKKNKAKVFEQIRELNFVDEKWYLKNNNDVRESGLDPLEHYVEFGWKEGRDPSLNFETRHYIELNPDVYFYDLCPLVHYVLFKDKRLILKNYSDSIRLTEEEAIKIIKDSSLFDSEFYLANNQDVRASGLDPVVHYYRYGWRENRLPSRKFNSVLYLHLYADVKKLEICPIIHYELIGKYQMRYHKFF